MVNSKRNHPAMPHWQAHTNTHNFIRQNHTNNCWMNTLLKLDFSPISPLLSSKTTSTNFWNDLDYGIPVNEFLWRIWKRWNHICIMHFSMNLISLTKCVCIHFTIWNIDFQQNASLNIIWQTNNNAAHLGKLLHMYLYVSTLNTAYIQMVW